MVLAGFLLGDFLPLRIPLWGRLALCLVVGALLVRFIP